MKKLAYILLPSLPFFGAGCQQNTGGDTGQGYGAENPQYSEDAQTGAGQVDETGMDAGTSNNGGTTTETTSTGDTMTTPDAVGRDEAASAADKTQTQVGNADTRGEANESRTNPQNARSSRGTQQKPTGQSTQNEQ